MSREVTLLENVRYFSKHGEGRVLFREGRQIEAGTTIETSEPETITYDNQEQKAVPFILKGKTFYMLLSEINVPELVS